MTDAMTEPALFELLSLECRVNEYGTVSYHNTQGLLHREYGPAVVYADGTRTWYQNGMWHRLDGPAVEFPNGRREWYQKDLLHRLDGPAIECPSGYRAWYINGEQLTQAEWRRVVASMGITND